MYWYKVTYYNNDGHLKNHVLFGGISFFEINQKINRWLKRDKIQFNIHLTKIEIQSEDADQHFDGTIIP